MGAFLSRDNQGQSHGNVVETCDASTGAAAVQMPASLSHETSSGADEEGENFDSFTPVKAKRKCRAPPGLRAPLKPSPPPTPAPPPEKQKLSRQEMRDAQDAQLLKEWREEAARVEARYEEGRQQLGTLLLTKKQQAQPERLQRRERFWSTLSVKFDNAEPSFQSCARCIEPARQISVLHAVCDRLASAEPNQRPRSVKSFQNFTRKARSIRAYTLDWQAVAAALGLSLQFIPQECKETPTELQLESIIRRFEVLKATAMIPLNLVAWIQEQSCVAKSYSAEEVLAELRKVGILSGPGDFGASMVADPHALLPEKEWFPATVQEASAFLFEGSKRKKIVSLATFELTLPRKGTCTRGGSCAGLLIGRHGWRIQAELATLKRKLAAAAVPVSKVRCNLSAGGTCCKRRPRWLPRQLIGQSASLQLKMHFPMCSQPVDQSFEIAKGIVIQTLEEWFKDMADHCDHWDDVYTERVERRRFPNSMVEDEWALNSVRDRIQDFLKHQAEEELFKDIMAERREQVVSAKTLSSERWEQQIYGRLRDVRHRQEQEDKIQRRVRMAQHNRRSERGRGMLAPAQVARVERRRRMVEVDGEPSAWDFTCK
eukprot:CAMPEP_0206445098 /NCGR_PEP_ID=MMETSP0324_2-20121206/15296_1 /ASSEMBLY_ACC=CAM_ASM_000836 /TAXON_ID=2866 /ORGANISM="Crypthecodinium cohnii, Strain Seligo" /LENGTH=599 /DNA_ID=CAMNT_0053913229 /DNA_START=70 /DNA_END=1869 /DNA_ORIENTATION=+